jgi:Putative adhesin
MCSGPARGRSSFFSRRLRGGHIIHGSRVVAALLKKPRRRAQNVLPGIERRLASHRRHGKRGAREDAKLGESQARERTIEQGASPVKRIARSLASSCLAFMAVFSHLGWSADRQTYPMDVPAAGVKTITFEVQEGEFVLHGDPTAQKVSMRLSIDRMWIFRLGEEGILKRLIKVSGEGTDSLKIVTDIPHSLSNWGRAQYPIDFEVVVPSGTNLNVIDTSGTIHVSDMQATVNVSDGSGTLSVDGVQGALTITKDSGDIVVTGIAGPTRITSKSGQMKLRELAALQIDQSDGNLDIMNVGPTTVHNGGGNVRIADVRGRLGIDDESGAIDVADAKGEVNIRDTSGQIRVLRAESVVVRDTSGDVKVDQASGLTVLQKESGVVKVSRMTGPVEVPSGVGLTRR